MPMPRLWISCVAATSASTAEAPPSWFCERFESQMGLETFTKPGIQSSRTWGSTWMLEKHISSTVPKFQVTYLGSSK